VGIAEWWLLLLVIIELIATGGVNGVYYCWMLLLVGLRIQRFKDSKIQRFKDSKTQRFKDSSGIAFTIYLFICLFIIYHLLSWVFRHLERCRY
jgi:hypothetical protein